MQEVDKFTYGNYYHIYNRGVNGCDIFIENTNYEYFMHRFQKYLSPVVEIYAWVLMPNHFHFALRVKTEQEIENEQAEKRIFFPKGNMPKVGNPSQQFSNFLNSYSQSFNKMFERNGNLFEKRFKRKQISDITYMKKVICYVHDNPVHHKFCNHTVEYSWSSYLSYVSIDPTRSGKNKVLGWFDDSANFICAHENKSNIDIQEIENFLEIGFH